MQTVKMVVTGPFSAGKTEFIQSVSEIDVVSTERKISSAAERTVKESTTVAMDFGRITFGSDLVLYLFGTPGQDRFDFMWEILSEGMLGFIVLVDGERPESLDEAAHMLELFRGMAKVPFVIAANKVNGDGDGITAAVRERLTVDVPAPVVTCDARDRESVKEVLLTLL